MCSLSLMTKPRDHLSIVEELRVMDSVGHEPRKGGWGSFTNLLSQKSFEQDRQLPLGAGLVRYGRPCRQWHQSSNCGCMYEMWCLCEIKQLGQAKSYRHLLAPCLHSGEVSKEKSWSWRHPGHGPSIGFLSVGSSVLLDDIGWSWPINIF